MQLDSFRYFIELARVGSFYGAAKNLYISQQGLNNAISSLEAELGVKLIERERRGVRLTASGEVLYGRAQVLMRDYADMLKDLYSMHASTNPGDARIPIHLTYYPARLSEPFVRQMKQSNSISIIEEPFQAVIEGARKSDGNALYLCDLYGVPDRLSDFPDLVFEPVIVSRAGVVWRDESPFIAEGSVHREQLADVPISIDAHREMRRLADYIMQDYPLNNIQQGIANPTRRIQYATDTMDISLLYDSFGFELTQANPELACNALHFTPLSTPRSIIEVGFFYPKKARPSVRARNIIEALHAHVCSEYPRYAKRYVDVR